MSERTEPPTRTVCVRMHVEHIDALDQVLAVRRCAAPWTTRSDLVREFLVRALEAGAVRR